MRAEALDAEDEASLRLTLDEKGWEKTCMQRTMTREQAGREMDWKLKAEEIKWKLLSVEGVTLVLGIIGALDPTPICDGTAAVLSYLSGNKLDAAEYALASVNKVGGLIKAGTKLSKLLCIGTRIGHGVICSYRAYDAYREGDWMQLGFSAVSFLRFLRTACFAGGTQVVVGIDSAGGYITRDIEQIQVGDWVLSQDQDDPAAEPVLRQVTGVEEHTVYGIRILQVRDEETGDVESIRVTEEHPFWIEGRGWTGAGDLRPGDRLVNPDGTFASVIANEVEAHPEGLAVYNLTVEGDHTYFVEDGEGACTPVWVHNSCGPGRVGKQQRLREVAVDMNLGRSVRGWLKQELNAIARGMRKTIRVPKGFQLAHYRGFEAKKGFSYLHSQLQSIALHRLQHKIGGY